MYSVRVNNRFPQVYRVCRPAACVPARPVSLMPRIVGNEFAPIFRLMDDFTNQIAARPSFDLSAFNSVRSFNPRFDIKETNEAYELFGELPGVDQKDISIEFTDAQTLSIKGRTETHREEGSRPEVKAVEPQSEPAPALSEAENTSAEVESIATSVSETSSYHRPTVEDEEVATSGPIPEVAEPAQTQDTSEPIQQRQVDKSEPQSRSSDSHYWVSERSVGQFQRSFAFPSRINQDNVHASLKDGILSIFVPKASLPANRRINIE